MTGVQIRLMGPIELEIDGTGVPLPRRQVRMLLTLLALAGETGASVDTIIEALWEADLPGNPKHAVHVYVNRLRKLHPAIARAVYTIGDGYRLDVPGDAVDVVRFEGLVERAHRDLAHDPAQARRSLDAALELWRGPAFGSLHYCEFLAGVVRRLEEWHLAALEDSCEAQLRLGRARRVIPDLQELTHRHPYRDRAMQLLVTALDADGRRTEALVAHRNYCRRIASELGVRPSFSFPSRGLEPV